MFYSLCWWRAKERIHHQTALWVRASDASLLFLIKDNMKFIWEAAAGARVLCRCYRWMTDMRAARYATLAAFIYCIPRCHGNSGSRILISLAAYAPSTACIQTLQLAGSVTDKLALQPIALSSTCVIPDPYFCNIEIQLQFQPFPLKKASSILSPITYSNFK
jgi:hypothetical protein